VTQKVLRDLRRRLEPIEAAELGRPTIYYGRRLRRALSADQVKHARALVEAGESPVSHATLYRALPSA